MSTKEYVKNLIKDPNIASITPTSQAGVRYVCSRMELGRPVVIVEYGPATGVFTNYLLERISADSVIIAVELNRNFYEHLRANNKSDRLKIHNDSAENIDAILKQHGLEQVDYVISGIPFSLMKPEMRGAIVRKTSEALKPGGKFLPYQTFFQKDDHLKRHLENYFPAVRDRYFLRNLPPMRIYEAIK